MKTPEMIAQWVIDNRYSKSEYEKVSNFEMYHEVLEAIQNLPKNEIPKVEFKLNEIVRYLGEDYYFKEHNNYKILISNMKDSTHQGYNDWWVDYEKITY
jgi:hypothetical protein